MGAKIGIALPSWSHFWTVAGGHRVLRLCGRVEDLERKYASRVREAKSSLEDLKEPRGVDGLKGK